MRCNSSESPSNHVLLNPGIYLVIVRSCKEKISKKGNWMMELRLEALCKVEMVGQRLTLYKLTNPSNRRKFFVFTYLVGRKSCIWVWEGFLAAIGQNLKLGEATEIDPISFLGKRAYVKIGLKSYQAEMRNYVIKWIPIDHFRSESHASPEHAPWEGQELLPPDCLRLATDETSVDC
jgi:hypothetical protein